jgi:hypothetical protein
MDRRTIGGGVIAIGVIMILIALLADALGIGESGFGWKRGVFLAAGVVVALGGLAYLLMPPRAPEGEGAAAPAPPGDRPPGPGDERTDRD